MPAQCEGLRCKRSFQAVRPQRPLQRATPSRPKLTNPPACFDPVNPPSHSSSNVFHIRCLHTCIFIKYIPRVKLLLISLFFLVSREIDFECFAKIFFSNNSLLLLLDSRWQHCTHNANHRSEMREMSSGPELIPSVPLMYFYLEYFCFLSATNGAGCAVAGGRPENFQCL